jgi:putative SOS response-associated peptidase YedK
MCGRYSITTAPEAMRRLFRIQGPLLNLEPRYNVAPTQDAPVIPAERTMEMMRWGLVPSWSKGGPGFGPLMINARSETVAEKPAYRSAFRDRRCLIPADGFYEWRKEADGKQPFRFTMVDGAPFVFAGLWERWKRPDGTDLRSFTIIVTTANPLVSPIHDRMPVILDDDAATVWLTGGNGKDLKALLAPFPAERMTATAVSRRVNSPKNDDPEVIQPL